MSPLPYTIGSLLCLTNAICWPSLNNGALGVTMGLVWVSAAWFCRALQRWADA
jgi:hypothetical protein